MVIRRFPEVVQPERRAFSSDAVTMIRRGPDSLWNGLLIGLGAGVVALNVLVATGDLPAYGAPVRGSIEGGLVVAAPVVGALVDRAIGNDQIYLAPSNARRASITVSPLLGNKAVGVSMAMGKRRATSQSALPPTNQAHLASISALLLMNILGAGIVHTVHVTSRP